MDALVQRAASGDEAAFAALVRRHQSRVRGFCLRLTRGDHALADDVAQETFVTAHAKLSAYRGDGSFEGWLCRIAWSHFLMELRRRKIEPDQEIEPADFESGQMARLDLEKAMARISVAERAALTLCFALGYSHEEAAGILNLPLGTLKSHVARGREKLQRLLTGWKGEP